MAERHKALITRNGVPNLRGIQYVNSPRTHTDIWMKFIVLGRWTLICISVSECFTESEMEQMPRMSLYTYMHEPHTVQRWPRQVNLLFSIYISLLIYIKHHWALQSPISSNKSERFLRPMHSHRAQLVDQHINQVIRYVYINENRSHFSRENGQLDNFLLCMCCLFFSTERWNFCHLLRLTDKHTIFVSGTFFVFVDRRSVAIVYIVRQFELCKGSHRLNW